MSSSPTAELSPGTSPHGSGGAPMPVLHTTGWTSCARCGAVMKRLPTRHFRTCYFVTLTKERETLCLLVWQEKEVVPACPRAIHSASARAHAHACVSCSLVLTFSVFVVNSYRCELQQLKQSRKAGTRQLPVSGTAQNEAGLTQTETEPGLVALREHADSGAEGRGCDTALFH